MSIRKRSVNHNGNSNISQHLDNNVQQQEVVRSTPNRVNLSSPRKQHTKLHIGVWGRIVLIVGVFTVLVLMLKELQRGSHSTETIHSETATEIQTTNNKDDTIQNNNIKKCSFRNYPSNRLYGLSKESTPNFLTEAAYIRGIPPDIINPIERDNTIILPGDGLKNVIQQSSPTKVCLDTSSWENRIDKDGKERLPFTDGHNPSIVSLTSNPYINTEISTSQQQQHSRLDTIHIKPIQSAFPTHSLDSLYLGVSIFGGGQCKFGFTPQQVDEYGYSLHDEPPGGKRAVINVLNSNFNTIGQTTLLLEKDERYGTVKRRAIQPEKNTGGEYVRIHQEFDDSRLFFHMGRVWVLYRNGPLFGYTDQIHNPIHFEEVKTDGSGDDDVKFIAYVKASETVWIGGGRNIALISEEPIGKKSDKGEVEWVSNPRLKALTWVDPVTVRDDIDLRGVDTKLLSSGRRLLEESNGIPAAVSQEHRRLGTKPNKSNIHGTNGYMVPLTSTGELLGIAHFHRPENRKESEYALHGHHYTHAFFTIARQVDDKAKDTTSLAPFKLKRLSNEFVFRANSIPSGEKEPPIDGDIIQFASGLDVVGGDVDGKLIISYGINDCEGAVFSMTMQKVQKMLIEVSPGQEVVDLMETIVYWEPYSVYSRHTGM